MIKVGINGFGRIGRAIFRINHHKRVFDVVAINELDSNVESLAYLLKYDSTYGRFDGDVRATGRSMSVDGNAVQIFSKPDSAAVPWERVSVDIVIDTSGVQRNVVAAQRLVQEARIRKAIISWSSDSDVDFHVISGVNESAYRDAEHSVVSASICDAGAVGPVVKLLDEAYGIEHGFITTLHPWLAYQNLVDNLVGSVAKPGEFFTNLALGRASVGTLIPKSTTLVKALSKVLPEVASRLDAISFRVPTAVVAASDMTLMLRRSVSAPELNDFFRTEAAKTEVIGYQEDPLISVDFERTEQSVVIDGRWTRCLDRHVKLVSWYDNEWGYSARVVDMVARMAASLERPCPADGAVSS